MHHFSKNGRLNENMASREEKNVDEAFEKTKVKKDDEKESEIDENNSDEIMKKIID
jgi:hypothetical protein